MTEQQTSPSDDGTQAPEPYNPDDHTVSEVEDYLATADEAEVTRVKAVEANGQNRKGVSKWEPEAEDTGDDAEPGEDTVHLRVTLPFWTDSFSVAKDEADSGNGQYVVTRAGVDVPADVVDRIVNAASASGVTVEVVEPQEDNEEN